MRRQILFFTFLFSSICCFSQNVSPTTEVALITCGQGDDLYSTFGHSALWYSDPATGIDKVYNYGTFDFDTPNFYLKFTQGKLDYILNVSTFNNFIRGYQYEGRWVYKQVLDLNISEKQVLYAFLENNALPKNRGYRYDFLYDNCSTRIRDALELALDGALKYPASPQDSVQTFRNMLDLYLTNHPWSDLGIDLALGAPCDKVPDWREKMFLPDFLKNHMAQATIEKGGQSRSLIAEEGLILAGNEALQSGKSSGILWIFWLICGVAILTSLFGNPRKMRWFDSGLFTIAGLLGIMIALLWFATDHTATKLNFNLFWALPTWLYGSYLLIAKKPGSRFFKYHALAMFAIIVIWALIPQNFHVATIPVILALTARSWAWQKKKYALQNSEL